MKNRLHKIKSTAGLSFSLAVARFKSQTEGSYLGVLWYILDPVIFFVIILSMRFEAFSTTNIVNYPIYILIGLILLNFFRKTTSLSLIIIEQSRNFVKNMRISQESLVLSGVLQMVLSHVCEIALLVCALFIFGGHTIGFLIYPFIFLSYLLFVTGISLLLSVAGAYIKDISNIWQPLTQLLLFGMPIFYSTQAGGLIDSINRWNPLFYYIDIFRKVVIQGIFPGINLIALLIFMPLLSLSIGWLIFIKYKYHFAEWV